MGKGIEGARTISPEAAAALEDMRDQLLIVFLQRLGGKASVPVAEVDDTGGQVMMLRLEGRTFHFEVRRKGQG
jgi:hypothetical protein